MKRIIIKEIDKLQSSLHKNKIITEYLMFFIDGDVKLGTSIELGEEAKNKYLDKLLETYCHKNSGDMFHEIIIEVIKFEEHKNNTNE